MFLIYNKKFKKKQCPDQLKEHLSIPLYEGQKITNMDQTLSEIGIKDNSLVIETYFPNATEEEKSWLNILQKIKPEGIDIRKIKIL